MAVFILPFLKATMRHKTDLAGQDLFCEARKHGKKPLRKFESWQHNPRFSLIDVKLPCHFWKCNPLFRMCGEDEVRDNLDEKNVLA